MTADRKHSTGFARVAEQFDLASASWPQRLVAHAILIALGGLSVPRPEAGDVEIAGITRKTIHLAGGYPLSYLEGGDRAGRLVVFIHGTPGNASGWADFLLQVPSGFRYLAPDRPGFGVSGPRDAVVSLAAQAEAVAALIRAQAAGRAIIVGHSYGGPVAAQIVADAPDIAAALVILAGSLDPAEERVSFAQHVGDTWPLRTLLARALRNANRELIQLKRELVRLAPRLKILDLPVVAVHGTADKQVPFANIAFIKAHLHAAKPLEIVALDGQDHYLPWNAKAQVDAAIARAAALAGAAGC